MDDLPILILTLRSLAKSDHRSQVFIALNDKGTSEIYIVTPILTIY